MKNKIMREREREREREHFFCRKTIYRMREIIVNL